MRFILGPAIILIFLTASAYGQSVTRNLKHLTREEYIHQLELCADSAYAETGVPNVESEYDGYTYEWIVGVIDELIGKNFKERLTSNADGHGDITYKVIQSRSKKNLSFALVFMTEGKEIGSSYFLFGIMTDKGVQGIVKIHSCKKEIKNILARI